MAQFSGRVAVGEERRDARQNGVVIESSSSSWHVVENSLDYLRTAVEDAAAGDDDRLKYAVLHLFAGIETLVKARLAREHWALTVEKLDGVKQAQFTTGDFRSVGAKQAMTRLRDLIGLPILQEHISAVESVEKLRNRAAHFALVGESPEGIRAALGKGLHFALSFLGTELQPGAPAREAAAIRDLLEEVAGTLGEIDALVTARLSALADRLQGGDPAVVCARCMQPAMLLEEARDVQCLFCFYAPEGEAGANEYVSDVLGESEYRVIKQGGLWPVHECLECGTEALVQGIDAPGQPTAYWGCFSCGYSASADGIGTCMKCGGLIHTGADVIEICDNCIAYALSRD